MGRGEQRDNGPALRGGANVPFHRDKPSRALHLASSQVDRVNSGQVEPGRASIRATSSKPSLATSRTVFTVHR